jgi:hypothetical protein
MHLYPRTRIECAEGLVKQQHLRLARQSLRKGKPLLHAARQGTGILIGVLRQADLLQQRETFGARIAARLAPQLAQHRAAFELESDKHIAQHAQTKSCMNSIELRIFR